MRRRVGVLGWGLGLLLAPALALGQGETPVRIKDGVAAQGEADVTNGALAITPRNSAGTEIGTAGTPLRVDPTGTTTQPVSGLGTFTVDSELPAAAALTDNMANPTAPAVGAFLMCWDGATWDRCPGTSANGLLVNLGANNAVTVTAGTVTANAGTNLNTSALVLDATVTGRLPAGSTPADNESNAITTTRIGTYLFCFDGTTWDRCPGSSIDGLLVNLGANNDVTVTGTVTTTPPTNASTNVAQFGSANVVTGTGASGAGIPRVTVANDSTVILGAGAATIGAVTQSGTWTVQPGNTANTTPWLASISQGGNTAAVNASSQLSVNCSNCTGSGASAGDQSAFTAGVSVFAPAGGEYDPNVARLTAGQQGTAAMTAARGMHANLRNSNGVELGTALTPLVTTETRNSNLRQGDVAAASDGRLAMARVTNGPAPLPLGRVAGLAVDPFGNLLVATTLAPVTIKPAPRGDLVTGTVTLTSTTETTILAAISATVYLDLTYVECTNTSATLTRVDIRDATGGTVRRSSALAASGGGFVASHGKDAPWPQTTSGNNWTVQLSGAVTDVRCNFEAIKTRS